MIYKISFYYDFTVDIERVLPNGKEIGYTLPSWSKFIKTINKSPNFKSSLSLPTTKIIFVNYNYPYPISDIISDFLCNYKITNWLYSDRS